MSTEKDLRDTRPSKMLQGLMLMALLVGCGTTDKPAQLRGDRLTETVDIRLLPATPQRIDDILLFERDGVTPKTIRGGATSIDSGPVWNSVFIGSEQSDITFTINSAVLEAYYCGYGCGFRYTYKVTGDLACNSKIFPVSTEGSQHAAWAMNNALHEAVELAVLGVAKRSMLIAEKCDDDSESRLGVYKELRELNELREQGIISDEEFEAEKKKILDAPE